MRKVFAIVRGCCLFLMLVATLLLVIMLTRVTPNLDAWFEFVKPYLADTAEEELVYFWTTYPYLPGDVELSDELKALAPANGFEEYDLQALIAGAARYNIRWGDVLAIQMNTQWQGGFADMFILSLVIAEFLDKHDYHLPLVVCPGVTPVPTNEPPPTPSEELCVPINPRHEAIKALYPAGGEEWFQRVLATSAAWEGSLHTATIVPIEPEDLFDLAVIYTELLSYQILGPVDVLVYDANGNPIIVPNADSPVIPYPGEIEGFFADPFPGSWITGYCFGCPVYKDGKLIRAHHPGVDLGGIGEAPVYAAHDGNVIYAGWMNSSTLWISGNVVAVKGTYPDGTPVCTLYGHGKNGTIRVGVGDPLSAGDQLMTADSTGFSSGTHLHIDLRFGEGNFCGQSVDPMPYIR